MRAAPRAPHGRLIVTIDGPAGSGKSTTARRVADALGYLYVDSGAMYRALALAVLARGLDPADESAVAALADGTRIGFAAAADGGGTPRVLVNGADVTDAIRTSDIDRAASTLAAFPAVRARLVALQREIAAEGGVVMEGRDIGTVVFPGADVKVFLDADLAVRAARRQKQRDALGLPPELLADVMQELDARDRRDRTRSESPLRVPDGAVVVDTTSCTIDEQVERVLSLVAGAARR